MDQTRLDAIRARWKDTPIHGDVFDLLAEVERLSAAISVSEQYRQDHIDTIGKQDIAYSELKDSFDAMTADRDAWRRRAESAEKDIRDMLYDATLLVDNGLCGWCGRWDNELCWSNDCKAECKWRGPEEDKP